MHAPVHYLLASTIISILCLSQLDIFIYSEFAAGTTWVFDINSYQPGMSSVGLPTSAGASRVVIGRGAGVSGRRDIRFQGTGCTLRSISLCV